MDLAYGLEVVVSAISFALPAYIANMVPLILSKIIHKRRPLDMGRNWIDGKRILGDNKSVEGFVAGVLAGLVTGFFLGNSSRGLLMGLGAMTGDALGSFIKRRLDITQGEPAPLLDQYLFILMALLFSYLAGFVATSDQLAVILIATPILHVSSNYIAYLLKIRQRPF
jgi:CDP-2,3-bis-(O-geranylgeranyl)-sn-glycerol synthase